MYEFSTFLGQAPRPKLPFSHLLPGTLTTLARWNPIPHRIRPGSGRRGRSRQKSKASYQPPQAVSALQTSFNPLDGVRALQRHRWALTDIQYAIVVSFIAFSFSIAPIPLWLVLIVSTGYSFLVLMPATRQFFLPSLPIWTYLLYFFCSRFIPTEYRPHIWVKVLPALENVLYGANLSSVLAAHTNAVLDVLAWLPYGIGHFANPAICSALLFLFAAPGTTPIFAKAFGFLSLTGVTMQLVFPCTPPWYEKDHGLEPAHYGMEGSPAGLARVDQLFGVDMYTTSFTTAPVPFGAFPSLHAGTATLEALFLSYCFPRFRPFFIGYVGWIWWATMYLNHHYAVDLVGGSLIAAIFFYVARTRYLPRRQLDKTTRWQYEYTDIGEKSRVADEEFGEEEFGLGLLHRRGTAESDEWSIGSGSSSTFVSSGESSGSMSPTTPKDDFRDAAFVGMTSPSHGHFWGGDRFRREAELGEVVVVR